MRKVIRIDSNGFYIEDVILQDGEAMPSDCTDIFCPDGFYKPLLQNGIWIEGMAQVDIDAIRKIPKVKTDIELMQDQIDALTNRLDTLVKDNKLI